MTSASAIAALGGVMFLRMLAVFITLPIIAVYADALQPMPSAALTGFALGAYGITQAAAQIGFGRAADKHGRKPALLMALAIFTLGALWASNAGSVGELIAARLLQGAGAAAAAIMAWLADITPPDIRARAMAIIGAGVGLAFALSLFAAAPIAGIYGAAGVFDAAAILGALAFAAVLAMPAPPPATKPANNPSILKTLSNRNTMTIATGAFSLHCALAVVFLLLPQQLMQSKPLAEHWQIYAPAFVLSLPFAFAILRMSDARAAQTTDAKPFLAAVLPVTAGLLIAANGVFNENNNLAADANTYFAASLFLFFAGFNAMEALLPAAASRLAPAAERGTIMGAILSCQFAGLFAGGAIGGILSATPAGAAAALTLSAVLLSAWFVVLWRFTRSGG